MSYFLETARMKILAVMMLIGGWFYCHRLYRGCGIAVHCNKCPLRDLDDPDICQRGSTKDYVLGKWNLGKQYDDKCNER
jgi:hypothetical protein